MLNVLFELDNVLRGADMAPPALATRDWLDLRLCDPDASKTLPTMSQLRQHVPMLTEIITVCHLITSMGRVAPHRVGCH